MKKILLFALLCFYPFTVFAQGNSGFVSIQDKNLQIISDNSPRIFLYDVNINNSGCTTHSDTPVLLMDNTNTLSKEIYSMLLTAKATGDKVNIVTDGCWIGDKYPIIFSVYLSN